mmetsp:Transcript_26575/g.38863  ORF Transcript_26575/g.38863 Transcript_26575/m.38863 type:complete len:86 (-) Transcript_26575:1678-1935(-)
MDDNEKDDSMPVGVVDADGDLDGTDDDDGNEDGMRDDDGNIDGSNDDEGDGGRDNDSEDSNDATSVRTRLSSTVHVSLNSTDPQG